MGHYDSIIIGAGHNGLVCAAYLAKAGQKVLLLEARDRPGGLAGRREFHPGFSVAVANEVRHFPRRIVRELELESHGLEAAPDLRRTVSLGSEGRHVILRDHSVEGVGAEDTDAYRKFTAMMHRFAGALEPFWLKTIPRAAMGSLSDLATLGKIGLKLRLLGRKDLREFMRIAALPARDLVDEFFVDDGLKATLCWDGLVGSRMAPRSPNNAVIPMLYRLSGGHRGGPVNLVEALAASAAASGVEIRFGAAVDRLLIQANADGQAVSGVRLAGGEEVEAGRVVSSADPQSTFFRMLGVENLEIEFTNRIRRLRCDGYVAKLHLALDGLPEFTGLDQASGRLVTAPDLDTIEFAFDDAKYGGCSETPVMEIMIPSLGDPSLAPAGQHVLSANVMYAPRVLKGGWSEAARDSFRDRALDILARHAPGIRDRIIHSELLTPRDIEKKFGVTGGHWHHTEFALDQALMMRPTYQAAQYSTPVPGLYLCGAGCHPAGDLTGAPGHNAAREILK